MTDLFSGCKGIIVENLNLPIVKNGNKRETTEFPMNG